MELVFRDVDIEQDCPAIAGLLSELGYEVDMVELRRRFDAFRSYDRARAMVAVLNAGVVAFATMDVMNLVQHRDPVARITAFVVTKSSRRRGVGQRLLQELETHARARGCRRMVVTSAEHRSDAHAFYMRAGWRLSRRRFTKELEAKT